MSGFKSCENEIKKKKKGGGVILVPSIKEEFTRKKPESHRVSLNWMCLSKLASNCNHFWDQFVCLFCYLHVSAYCLRQLYILGVNRVLGILTQNKLRKKLSCYFSLFFFFSLINILQKSILYSIWELLHVLPNGNFFFFFLRETLVDSLNKK